MKLFQRFEVWLLLALAAGTTAFVFLSSSPHPDLPAASVGGTAETEARTADGSMTVRRLTLVRDFGNARLDIDARLVNTHAKTLQMVPPDMRLVSRKDRNVPEYFLPTEPPPELPAKSTTDVRLRYWLEKEDLQGRLALVFEGQSLELKSAKPFDLEKLKNAELTPMPFGDWP